MKQILNLTQHVATAEQSQAGVIEPTNKLAVQTLLTFDTLPNVEFIKRRAEALAFIATNHGVRSAMIGGAPFLMPELENQLRLRGITPLYAFSQRVSEEKIAEDGSVTKINVFKHVGFVGGVR